MEANELRIGNYFIGYSNHLQQWELASFGLLIEGIEVDEIIRGFVPLTEEWLVKIGYEKMPSGTYLQPNSGNFIWFEQGLKCSIAGEYYPENIKYVHQLQNLHFALTGEELKNS